MKQTHPPICDYEGSDYQAAFWEQGGRAYEDRVEAIALKRLLPPGGASLLELGAGAGRNTPRYHGFSHIVLVDYSLSQLQQAQLRLGRGEHYTYVAADAYRLPFIPSLFDAATMIRVLHHMADAPQVLKEIRSTLRPGAPFILEFANKQNIKAVLRYALRLQDWSPFSPEPVEFAALNFDFHPRTVRCWLKENGFDVQRQLTVSHFRIGLLKRLVPTGLLVRMDALAQWTGNWWQFSPSVFVKAVAVGNNSQTASEAQDTKPGDFFRCPACLHSPLAETPDAMICPSCSRRWPVQDGIYDFRAT